MPNWKKVIVSGSDASLNSLNVTAGVTGSLLGTASYATQALTASNANTASYVSNAVSASFASTASFVNTLNQNVLITGSLTVGSTSLGANENTLVLGPAPAGGTGEGGQLLLQAPGGTYTSASMWDNWQNYTRLLRGTNASSDAVVAQFNMHSKQVSFPQYNSPTAFTATTLVGLLGFDSSGNLLTTTTSSGGGGGGVTITNNTDNYIITATGTANTLNGESNLQFNGSSLTVTGQITSSGAIISNANNTMYFRGGDDAEFWDINVANTVGIYGQQTQGIGAVKLGSGGPTLYGSGSNLGIGTTTPNSGTLHVNGGVFASSFTGSLLGTASYAALALTASNANTASYVITAQTASYVLTAQTASYVVTAQTASYVLQAVSSSFASTASFVNRLNQNVTITGSLLVSGSSVVTGSLNVSGSVLVTGSLNTTLGITGSSFTGSFTGSLLGTASYATTALTSSLTSTYVGFGSAGNALTGNSNFVVNTTTGYSSAPLVINVGGVPSAGYDIFNHFQMPYQITAFKSTTSGNPSELQIYNNANALQFGVEGSSAGLRMGGTLAYNMYFGCYYNYGLTFHTNNQAVGAISAAGNWFFGGNSTASAKVHIKGSGSTSATTAFLTQNSSGTNLLKVTDDGATTIVGNTTITGSTQITGSLGVTGSIYSSNIGGYAGYFKNNSFTAGGDAPLIIDDGNPGAGMFSLGYGNGACIYTGAYLSSREIRFLGAGYYGVLFEGVSAADGVTSFVAPGRVKIGNFTLPSSKLHVVGAGSTSATTAFLTQNSSGTDLLKVTDDGATTIVGNTTITGSLTVSSSNATQLQVGSNLLYVNNSNDVGIGTTSPSSYLAGTSGLAVRNSNAGGQGISLSGTNNAYNWLIYRMGSGAYLSFYEQAYNRERLTIAASGEVGIGAPTTAAKLAIYGAGSTSATTTLLLQNASSTDLFKITDNGATTVIGTLTVSGSTTLTGSLNITGSILNSPITLPTSSGTASMDCSRGNFFNLTLSSSYALHLSASNIQPGQTINLRLTQPATSGSLTYTSQFKFAGGIPYSASATGSAVDIISFISFDTSTLYGSAIKNVS